MPEPKWAGLALDEGDLVINPETSSEVRIRMLEDVLPNLQEVLGRSIGKNS